MNPNINEYNEMLNEQYEKDNLLEHINIGEVMYFDNDKGKYFKAELEIFGHCASYKIFENSHLSAHTKSMSFENYEMLSRIKTDRPEGLIVEIVTGTFFMSKEQYSIITKHYSELNKKFIGEKIDFKNIIDEYVENLLQNADTCELIESYISQVSPLYLMDWELIAGIEYKLLNKIFEKGIYLMISNESTRDGLIVSSEKKDDIDESTTLTYERLRNEEDVNQYIDNNLYLLAKLIDKTINNLVYSIFSTYKILYLKAIKYYSLIWSKEYGEFFLDIEKISLKEAIMRYCSIETILHEKLVTAGTFIFFLMDNNKFDDNSNYITCYNVFVNELTLALEDKKLNDFENKIRNNLLKKLYSIDDVDLMNGSEFENFIALIFSKMGYSTTVTKASGDQGIDVIAEKNGSKIGIQAKCYSSAVSNSAIQEAVAGINHYICNKAIVVTNNYFTKAAVELANSNNVVLWDRNMLKEKINQVFNSEN